MQYDIKILLTNLPSDYDYYTLANSGTRCFQVKIYFQQRKCAESYGLLTDVPIISIVLVILGVPGKVLVIVHVEEGFSFLGSLVEIGEGHGGASDPVETPFLHPSCPVVRPVLWVDHHQDVLDELVLLLVEDVDEIGALLSAAVHGRLKVEPGG